MAGSRVRRRDPPRAGFPGPDMALKTDRLGPRPVKEHRGSPRSIDLGICAVGAYDRATHHAAQPVTTFRNNYEDGGLTFAGR